MSNKKTEYKLLTTEKNIKVKDIAVQERPREKIISKGVQYLSNAELIAVIIGSGTVGSNVIDTANSLINNSGSLIKLLKSTLQELTKHKGIGKAKACQLLALFEITRRFNFEFANEEFNKLKEKEISSPDLLVELIRSKIIFDNREHFYLISFDARNRLINIDEISQGSMTASVVHPRETFEMAIKRQAVQIVISHNHPSGDVKPSPEDNNITLRIKEAGIILGIKLIDHIIISKTGYFSFKENKML
ncbi:MAG TPA: DNA repair protein RadC [Ignavibacteria bacterium]|nr:DNA repair protein RadC [Ignavibacteria bacterium]